MSKALLPVALIAHISQAVELPRGIELRFTDPSAHGPLKWPLNFQGSSTIPAQNSFGDLAEVGLNFGLGEVEISSGKVKLSGLSLAAHTASWHYEKHPFLDITCTQLALSFEVPTLTLNWPALARFRAVLPIPGPLSIQGLEIQDLEGLIVQALAPVFRADSLRQSLRLTGDCPGNGLDLLKDYFVARLTDFPTKDASTVRQLVAGLNAKLSYQWLDHIGVASRPMPFLKTVAGRWILFPEEGSNLWVLRSVPPGSLTLEQEKAQSEFLDPQSRSLLNVPPPGQVDAVVSQVALQSILNEAAAHLPQVAWKAPTTLLSRELAPFLDEFSELPEDLQVSFDAHLAHCTIQDYDQVHPWLSSTGRTRGLDLNVVLEGAFHTQLNSGPLDVSRVVPLSLTAEWDEVPSPDARLVRLKARWNSTFRADAGCGDKVLEADLGLGLDWLLGSAMFQSWVEDRLNESLAENFHGNPLRKITLLGHGDASTRREAGGYFAEALQFRFATGL